MFLKKSPPQYIPVRPRRMNHLIFLGYLIIGFYFINYPFEFIEVPDFILDFNQWIILAGGILMLIGALNYFKLKKR